jgi:hypothetical protein
LRAVDANIFPQQFAVHFPQRVAYDAVFRHVGGTYGAILRRVSGDATLTSTF